MIPELDNPSPEDTRRINALREVLIGDAKRRGQWSDNMKCSIYCFRDTWGGLRISEISYSHGSGGASWMAGDLDAFPYIFAAERYLMWCFAQVEDHGDGAVLDLEQEARRGLLYWLDDEHDYNTLPEWAERSTNPLAS